MGNVLEGLEKIVFPLYWTSQVCNNNAFAYNNISLHSVPENPTLKSNFGHFWSLNRSPGGQPVLGGAKNPTKIDAGKPELHHGYRALGIAKLTYGGNCFNHNGPMKTLEKQSNIYGTWLESLRDTTELIQCTV